MNENHKSVDMHLALQDPQQVFTDPEAVVDHPALKRDDKIKILQHWEYDVRDVEVAEEEGMPSDNSEGLLKRILKALEALGASPGTDDTRSPTKHGNG